MKAREAAFRVVHEVLYKRGYSNIALDQILEKNEFDGKDAGFITEIVLGTLRNKLLLEHIVSKFSKMKVNKISPSAMTAILTGAYQILYMDRTPDSAACNESVKLASKFAGQRARGFVNAILRSISREKDAIEDKYKYLNGLELISVVYSCSLEAVEKLIRQYGEEKTVWILNSINHPAHTCVRFNNTDECEANEEILKAVGIEYSRGKIIPSAYYLKINKPVASLDLYKDGIISIQDEGAQAMGEFASPEPGSEVLDACASPGGKTVHMASVMNGTGSITACDIYPQRVENMRLNFLRTGFSNIESMLKDMSLPNEEFRDRFDTVLVDAPCSGLGTAQRRPEIKLFYKEDHSLYDLQQKILSRCADYVKPGGTLVYGTCTLFKEENRDAVDSLLGERSDFGLVEDKTILPDGYAGGFYMARLVRKK